MTKKIITYICWAVSFACASLFVEGVGELKKHYNLNNASSEQDVHTIDDVGLTDDEKLIVAFAFETNRHGWQNVSVGLNVGGQDFALNEVVTTSNGRFSGLYYLDVSSSHTALGTSGTISIDLGTYSGSSNNSNGYQLGDPVMDYLGATVMSVSGLKSGNADYSLGEMNTANTIEVDVSMQGISDGMFAVTAFNCNTGLDNPNPEDSNSTYTNLYHTGIGSAGGSFGYIGSFESSKNDLRYFKRNADDGSSIAYASWAAAIPEPSQASAVIALLTICFYAMRRRVAY